MSNAARIIAGNNSIGGFNPHHDAVRVKPRGLNPKHDAVRLGIGGFNPHHHAVRVKHGGLNPAVGEAQYAK